MAAFPGCGCRSTNREDCTERQTEARHVVFRACGMHNRIRIITNIESSLPRIPSSLFARDRRFIDTSLYLLRHGCEQNGWLPSPGGQDII